MPRVWGIKDRSSAGLPQRRSRHRSFDISLELGPVGTRVLP